MMECQPVCDFHFFGSLVLMLFFGQIFKCEALCTTTVDGIKRYGNGCNFRCHCFNRTEQCNTETGACTSGCDFEWTGPSCQFRNIALGRNNSRHLDNIHPGQFSYLANDRDITTCSYTDKETASQTRTRSPWWALWSPHDVTFSEFEFMTENAYLKYFPGFKVTVQQGITKDQHEKKFYRSGELCYQHDTSTPTNKKVHVMCTRNFVGNQLRIQLTNTSTQLVLCDVRVYGGCDDGIYGEKCSRICSKSCRNTNCSKKDGTCTDGCNPGFTGNNCTKECEEGTYGEKCKNNCSAFCDGPCNKVNGTCMSCKAGWKGDNCTSACDDWKYGKGCSKNCSNHCFTECNKTDGSCSPCKAGWKGDNCSTECEEGTYGDGCKNNCSLYCNGPCDKVNGTCTACKAGWKGDKCASECDDWKYGKECKRNCSNHCVTKCNKTDGSCSPCKAGWKGDKCSTECDEGMFGTDCDHTCSQNCEDICNKESGTCTTCRAGWIGNNCTTECKDGYYGTSCNNICNPNCDGICNKVNGKCMSCNAGWKGDTCSEECSPDNWGENCKEICGKCLNESCSRLNGTCLKGCMHGFKASDNCTEECETGTYGFHCTNSCGMCKRLLQCHKATGICSEGCQEGYSGSLCIETLQEEPQPFPVAGVVGGASGALVVVALIVTGILCLRKRRQTQRSTAYKSTTEDILSPALITKDKDTKRTKERGNCQNVYCNTSEVENRFRDSQDVTNQGDSEVNECDYANDTAPVCTKTEHGVLVSKLKDYVKKSLADKKCFEDEFKTIPYGMQYPATVARSPKNVGKNRYKSMYAYDNTRVILKKEGPESSDYINASNIMGYSCGNSYIAAQGPIQNTLDDFWRMIWEKNIRTIIMATNLSEEGKMKCLQYWPEIGQTAQYGHLKIVLESEDEFTQLVVRRLKVSHEANPEKWRTVTQFHYRAWPDKGVPRCTSSLLHFWYQVRKHDAKKVIPWLVHCSAGVGRTGTFIALDILYDEGTDKGSIDIYQCVNTLREQRVNMVQTKEQYVFLYKIMLEALVLAWKPVNMDKFPSVYDALREVDHRTGKTHLLLQYESLAEEPEVGNEQETQDELYSSAKKTENREKNRYDNILAPNEFRPFLYTQVTGCTDYLNAIYIPGYRYKHAYIITQAPLMTTAVDCCRLLIEEEIKVVVTFEDHNDEEVGEYLPARGIVKIGPFTSTFISEEDRSHSVLRNFEVKFKSQKHSVTQLIFKHWSPSKLTPSNVNEMLYFLEEVERLQRLTDCKPILIQCLNGAERSGLVAVLMNILERVRYDNEVSIIQVVRQMKVRRQQIIPNLEQYKFCHDVLLSHIQNNSTYANM